MLFKERFKGIGNLDYKDTQKKPSQESESFKIEKDTFNEDTEGKDGAQSIEKNKQIDRKAEEHRTISYYKKQAERLADAQLNNTKENTVSSKIDRREVLSRIFMLGAYSAYAVGCGPQKYTGERLLEWIEKVPVPEQNDPNHYQELLKDKG